MTDVPPQLILTPTTPDYVGIFNQLQTDLIAGGYWTDLSATATGTAIQRWIASIGAEAQGSIGRALQEAYLDTARSPSGVFRAVRLQGVHLIRTQPGTVEVTITRTDSLATQLVIPIMQQFTIGGQNFYNPNPITLSVTGTSVTATLNRGTIASQSYTSSGNAYQRYIIGNYNAWNISDTPFYAVDINGIMWSGIRTGLWLNSSKDLVLFDSTLPDGTVECKFGDGTYGAIPPAGIITFYYATLDTAAATLTSPAVGTVGSSQYYPVSVTTTSIASANVNPPPPDFYKAIGPGGPAIKYAVSNRSDYRAAALQYQGVIDALFQGQAELNPSDLRYMNIIGVTLLTSSPWSQDQWLAFKKYFETIGIATTTLIRIDPTPVPVTINIIINIKSNASISGVTSLANQVISSYFTPSNQSLGWSLEPSDLMLALAEQATYLQAPGESGELIDSMVIRSPIGPVSVPPTGYLTLAAPPTLTVQYTKRGMSVASTGKIAGL